MALDHDEERPRIDALLEAARAGLPHRPRPGELAALVRAGAVVVDTRPTEQRAEHGELPGALVLDRNVLEWRLDPTSPHRCVDLGADQPVVLVCQEGYASSLAAASLQQLGLKGATDLDGGFAAWKAWMASRQP